MATDYDAPRKTDEESEDSIEELKTRRNDKNSGKVDEDEVEAAESFELPGADLSHEELTVRVLPRQADEFTCASCFLVKHRSQIAATKNGQIYCVDCDQQLRDADADAAGQRPGDGLVQRGVGIVGLRGLAAGRQPPGGADRLLGDDHRDGPDRGRVEIPDDLL